MTSRQFIENWKVYNKNENVPLLCMTNPQNAIHLPKGPLKTKQMDFVMYIV